MLLVSIWASLLSLGMFPCMILVKIWSTPLTWDYSLLSMPIIQRFGFSWCPIPLFSSFVFGWLVLWSTHILCLFGLNLLLYFQILIFCLLLDSLNTYGFSLDFFLVKIKLLGVSIPSSFHWVLVNDSVSLFNSILKSWIAVALSISLALVFSWASLRFLFS